MVAYDNFRYTICHLFSRYQRSILDLERASGLSYANWNLNRIKGKEITEYKYLLSIEENFHYEEGDDCRALFLKEGRNGDFKNKVIPKINEIGIVSKVYFIL